MDNFLEIIINNIKDMQLENCLKIDSIFIEKNGNIEKNFYNEECLHCLWSISKLLTAMAVGIAIDKKLLIDGEPLNLNTNIYSCIKDKVNINKLENLSKIKQWTLKDLLLHATGYEKQMLSEKCIVNVDKTDLINYALNYDIPYDVGIRYAYNNAEPFIISVLFSECLCVNLGDFINENIFKRIGVKEYKWENYGKYCPAATGLYLKHTDFHKIGQILLNNGRYENEQIIPEYWIKEMCKMQIETPNDYKETRVFPKIGAGYFTFVSRDGYIFRDGKYGQYIIINREKELLITILSSEEDMKNITEIFRDVL